MSNLHFCCFFILLNNFWCIFVRKSELKCSAGKVKMCIAFSLKAPGMRLKEKSNYKKKIRLRWWIILPHFILNEGGSLQISTHIFLPFFRVFFFPPVFHSQELACQTDSFLMNCLVEKRRNLWQAAAWIHRGAEGCSCSLWGRHGPPPLWCWGHCQLELRGALGHTNSPSTFCKRQWVCCVVLVQRARYLFKVLFVELEKRQALEEGRNLEVFCSFFFF